MFPSQFNRRCHSQQFTEAGVYHYTCVSLTPNDRNSEYAPDDVWSTVVVDNAVTETIVKDINPAFYRNDHIHIFKVRFVLVTLRLSLTVMLYGRCYGGHDVWSLL